MKDLAVSSAERNCLMYLLWRCDICQQIWAELGYYRFGWLHRKVFLVWICWLLMSNFIDWSRISYQNNCTLVAALTILPHLYLVTANAWRVNWRPIIKKTFERQPMSPIDRLQDTKSSISETNHFFISCWLVILGEKQQHISSNRARLIKQGCR